MGVQLRRLSDRSSFGFRILARWAPFAVVATGLCLLVAGAVQQDLRHGADDPQIQLAEDAAAALAGGRAPATVLPADVVDVAQSLTPFVVVYDATGRPVASSALLDGQAPVPPSGVFASARQLGEDRLTWQPRPDVRVAAVVVPYAGTNAGFVLAGRSLREVERRESQLSAEVVIAWLATLGGSLVTVVLFTWVGRHDRGGT